MSLDITGFDKDPTGRIVTIKINDNHPLIKLANRLPWQEMLEIILPELQNTEHNKSWLGRPLKIRIHLGIYLLQQMYNLTDPKEYSHHAREVQCFNKNKIGKQIQHGRHYQIARVKGNFAYVGPCVDLQMTDAHSVELMVAEHGRIFNGENNNLVSIKSIAFDRGYHTHAPLFPINTFNA